MTAADYDALPRYAEEPASGAGVMAALIGVAAPALLLAALAARGFRRLAP
jgi:ABC-2 type transport system permease protein